LHLHCAQNSAREVCSRQAGAHDEPRSRRACGSVRAQAPCLLHAVVLWRCIAARVARTVASPKPARAHVVRHERKRQRGAADTGERTRARTAYVSACPSILRSFRITSCALLLPAAARAHNAATMPSGAMLRRCQVRAARRARTQRHNSSFGNTRCPACARHKSAARWLRAQGARARACPRHRNSISGASTSIQWVLRA